MLENRRERRHTDTSTNEQDSLVVEEVLGRGAKRTVDHDTRQNAVHGRVRSRADDLAARILLALAFPVEVAADSFGERPREVTDDTNVDGDVVFLGRTTCTIRHRATGCN